MAIRADGDKNIFEKTKFRLENDYVSNLTVYNKVRLNYRSVVLGKEVGLRWRAEEDLVSGGAEWDVEKELLRGRVFL